MPRMNFYKSSNTNLIIYTALFIGLIIGIVLGFHTVSNKLLVAGLLGIPFVFFTITRPWIAVSIFFLLTPLEELLVIGSGNITSTLNKLMGAYLLALVVTSGSLKHIDEVIRNKKVLLILLFGLVSVFSLYFSVNPSYSMKYLIKLWLLIISYCVLILMIRNLQTLNYALYALIAGAVVSVLSPIVLGHGDIATANSLERYGGLWGDQNEFAGMLLVILPICIAIIFTTGNKNLKIILSACTAVLFAGFLLTYSRSGFVAFCVLSVVAMFKFIKGKNRLRILSVLVPCCIIGFIVIYYTIGDSLISRVETLRILESRESVRTETSLNLRFHYYFELFPKLFAEHPLMGVGFRGFVLNNPVYKQIAHNTFIEVITGTGLLGFIPFVLVLYLTWRDIRKARTGLIDNPDGYCIIRYSNALEMGYISFLVVGLFYSLDINKILWLLITLSSILLNIRNLQIRNGKMGRY